MEQNQQIDTEPTVDMDDTTGSNGGSSKDRFTGEADITSDEQGDDYTHPTKSDKSRSDTARVDSSGVSGGTDSSQAGGRSQY